LTLGFSSSQQENILIVHLEGTITSMSVELMKEALESASESEIPIILLINTQGGSLDATFDIIEAIERSDVPVIGYVYPEGSVAWSAGTYILLSTHIAAMAPHTILGSAQPVSVQPFGGAEPVDDPKVLNALRAFIVEKARMHGRNETVAEEFINENLNLSGEEAKEAGVIEFVSSTIDELLINIDDTMIETPTGSFQIQTENVETLEWSPSLRIFILTILSEPFISYLLFIIGIYSLIFGVTSPGYGGEILGAILVILGIIGLGYTGANIGGLILIGLGAILLIAELFSPSFGLLGSGGIFCMALGGILLLPSGPWIISPDWLNTFLLTILIIPTVVGLFFIFAAYKIIKARRRTPFFKNLDGAVAVAIDDISPDSIGFVSYQGEYWRAKSRNNIKSGSKVKILKKDGSIVYVEVLPDQSD
jgi:membrane-bound serine protease (ClpP class)